MNVEPITATVRDLSQGYTDDAVGGVTAYGGNLDVRPTAIGSATRSCAPCSRGCP